MWGKVRNFTEHHKKLPIWRKSHSYTTRNCFGFNDRWRKDPRTNSITI